MTLSLSRLVAAGALVSLPLRWPAIAAATTEDGPPPANAAAGGNWAGWTCDELTPDLCDLEVETGRVEVRGGLSVKYWIYRGVAPQGGGGGGDGDGDGGAGAGAQHLPIVMLHGGPAWPHDYMLPLKQQACRGRDVVFYDQGGCGESAAPPASPNASSSSEAASAADRFPWLLDPAYYSGEELPAVLSHLGLGPGRGRPYHLLGSSWGTMLAQLFVLDAATPDDAPTSLVLSGPLSDMQSYIRAQWDEDEGNLGSLPPFVQSRVHALQSAGAFSSPEYGAINGVLTTFFTCRTAPFPDCLVRSAGGQNAEIYAGMQGPSEFSVGGSLANFNTTGRLGELGTDLPVLLTSGKYDTMRPSVVDAMERAIPTVERVTLERSGHVSMIDEPGPMNDAVADFLDRVEAAAAGGGPFVPRARGGGGGGKAGEAAPAAEAPKRWPLLIVLQTIGAFIVGLVIGNWNANRSRRQGYETVDPAE